MTSYILAWCLLVVGVSDAKAHRIPNKLLLTLLVAILVSCITNVPSEFLLSTLLDKSAAFAICFFVSLGLHLLRVMAPGDVKFIAVLGFWLGTAPLTSYLFYVCSMTAFVGSMYWALNQLEKAKQMHTSTKAQIDASRYSVVGMTVRMEIGKQKLKQTVSTGQGLTYMPFAPILIMGLALQQYYA